jgi:S-methylmethionine-dependent homocysteine/selenocysteine methylase
VDALLERSRELKQALTDFVLDAEGELAESLEAYAAAVSSRRDSHDRVQQDLIIDMFLTEGKVGDKTPIDLFLESQPDLSQSDRQIVSQWRHSFIGLFAVTQVLPDGFELMNWLTAKQYIVKPSSSQTLKDMARFKEGEILLTRIAPLTDTYWTFSGPCTPMGKLGKPKLSVAIGNFKDNYKNHLYSDAPDLLEEAWQSVEQYHQQFIEFFGSDEVTMPGYQLNKKVAEFQESILQKRFAAAGIDESKSLAEVAQEAGVGEEEIKAAAAEAGADSKVVSQLFDSKSPTKMVMPKVDLPAELRKAEQVTAMTHPRWGQIFLPNYSQFKALLEAEEWQSVEGAEKLIRYYLENSTINAFVWYKLAQQYPNQLEKILQAVLARPNFQLERDLNSLLQEYHKPIEPELPEIASVPLHLHNLFQEAVAEVNKPNSKSKSKKKTGFGFQKP